MSTVRTRFAPSPTGPLHMGNARTALFNYLFAKNQKGVFLLRIEDTDKERSKPEWEKDVLENLEWLGLKWDEGPAFANATAGKPYIGDYGPYHQSKRTQIYKKYLEKLIKEKKAYYCYCPPDELEAQKQDQMSRGEAPRYTGVCRTAKQQEDKPSVIRFLTESKQITFQDLIRGKISFETELLGDFVIAKDLETPLYNFSVVVDDNDMNITHVIRGEDHIPNTPKQILMQEALGLSQPQYAHLPLLLGEDRSKLSKRHGDNSVTTFREKGYLPEAATNFLSLLGWNPGDTREIFSLEQLIEEFSLKRIQKGGAVFNINRFDYINGYYLRNKSLGELVELCLPYFVHEGLIEPIWKEKSVAGADIVGGHFGWKLVQECIVTQTKEKISLEQLEHVVALYQERLQRLSDIVEFTDFFFAKQLNYQKELLQWKKATDEETKESLKQMESILGGIDTWDKENLEKIIMPQANEGKDRGYMLWPFRVALTGKKASAGPFEIAEVLGKEQTIKRVQYAQKKL